MCVCACGVCVCMWACVCVCMRVWCKILEKYISDDYQVCPTLTHCCIDLICIETFEGQIKYQLKECN